MLVSSKRTAYPRTVRAISEVGSLGGMNRSLFYFRNKGSFD